MLPCDFRHARTQAFAARDGSGRRATARNGNDLSPSSSEDPLRLRHPYWVVAGVGARDVDGYDQEAFWGQRPREYV
ncbi:predicted protein [Streptomyces iranensis]|uniref:Uncharacterized protein n=1 Tax=Streptomyces iranensis TaxID=576784 RepID=A0A061A4Q4_9ACTN|nr:predicted protein [Streptomyces iranensis]